MKARAAFVASLAAAATGTAFAQAPDDPNIARLAADRGCSLCHPAVPPRGDSVAPSAPSWQEIASRYRGRKDAEDDLTRIVISGSDPASRHWKEHAAFTQMLPNAIEVTPEEARSLVRWVLGGAT